MDLSDAGAAFIAKEEGISSSWYKDSLGNWTIGIGHLWNPATDADFEYRDLSIPEIWDLFRADAERYIASVNDSVTVPLTQTQFDRLVSFAFNWGISPTIGFPATSVVRLLNAGDFAGAAADLVDGKGPGGRPYDKALAGVRARRIREAEPFKTAGGPMKLVTRAQWGARSATTSTNITPAGVAIHWEGPGMGTPAHSECAARVRGIQAFHMDGNGWSDVAYSAIACPHGYVFEGRGPGHRTAANGTDDGNQRFYAVCFLGGEGDDFTDEAKQAINDAIGWLGGGQIVGHRDLTSTACPGDEIYAWAHAGHPTPDPGGSGTPDPPPPPPEEDDMLGFIYHSAGSAWLVVGGQSKRIAGPADLDRYQGAKHPTTGAPLFPDVGDLTVEEHAILRANTAAALAKAGG